MDGTSSGPIVAASVENPGSPEAVFVPFKKADFPQFKKYKKKDDFMKKIVESINTDKCSTLLSQIMMSETSEKSPAKLLREAAEQRRIAECKKNKDKFRELLRKKRAKRDAAKNEEKPENGAEMKPEDRKNAINEAVARAKAKRRAQKLNEGKLSARDRVAAAMAKLKGKQISERKFDREAEPLRNVLGRKTESATKEGQQLEFDNGAAFIRDLKNRRSVHNLKYDGTEDGVLVWVDVNSGDRFLVKDDPNNSDLIDAAVQAIIG